MVGCVDRLLLRNRVILTVLKAISEGHGDTALSLLKAGAETDKKDVDGQLAIDLAPDMKVCDCCIRSSSLRMSLIPLVDTKIHYTGSRT